MLFSQIELLQSLVDHGERVVRSRLLAPVARCLMQSERGLGQGSSGFAIVVLEKMEISQTAERRPLLRPVPTLAAERRNFLQQGVRRREFIQIAQDQRELAETDGKLTMQVGLAVTGDRGFQQGAAFGILR